MKRNIVNLGILLLVAAAIPQPVQAQAVNNSLNKKVLVVIYNPILSSGQKLYQTRSWGDPNIITQEAISAIRDASTGFVNYTVVETQELNQWPRKTDGFRYDEATYNTCRANINTCHFPDDADYTQMWSDLNICNKVSTGQIDEVFVWGAGYFGFDEFAFKIPGDAVPYNRPTNFWLYQNRTRNIPDCNGKTVFVMGWIPERGTDLAIHSYGHRIESALSLSVGRGFWDGCRGTSDFDKFTCITKDINTTTPVQQAGCGAVHFPPNGLQDYDYSNSTSVSDTCESWNNYSSPTSLRTENCSTWDCNERQFYLWWMGHIPRNEGVTANGNLRNWWKYIVDFDNAVAEAKAIQPTPTPTPRPTATPTPTALSTDVDRNGCIGIVDFTIWRVAFQTNIVEPNTYPDINGDGILDILDFTQWHVAMREGENVCP